MEPKNIQDAVDEVALALDSLASENRAYLIENDDNTLRFIGLWIRNTIFDIQRILSPFETKE